MRVRRYLLIAVLLAVAACGSDEASGDVAARLAASTTTALPSTTTTERPAAIAPSTAPEETAVSTTSTTTTTAAPLPTFAPGNAGSRGPVGCRGDCPSVGLQDLDGQENVVLENLTISNPEGRCLTIRGARNITIRNVTVSECGTQSAVWDGYDTGLILIEDSSGITIESSIITRMAAEDHGGARNNAIHVIDSTDVQIINNEISDVFSDIERKAEDQGNRAISVQGSSSGLTIEQNTFRNAGRNALQLARARDLEGVSFSDNLVEGRGPWDSDYEDMISLYSASGTPDDPIVIKGNYLRNGGPSVSGTAMILGDGDQSNGPTAHVIAEANVIVNPGHAGVVLAGGTDISVVDNIVLGDLDVPHPTTTGMAINNYGYTGVCRDHQVVGNRVYMQNQHVDGGVNHVWIPNTCTDGVVIEDNIFGDGTLHPGVWVPN